MSRCRFANDQLDRFNPKWELLGYPKLSRKPIYVEIQPPKSEIPRRFRRGALGGLLRRWYTAPLSRAEEPARQAGVRRRLAKARGSRHLRSPHVPTGPATRFKVLATLTIARPPSAMVGARDLPLR